VQLFSSLKRKGVEELGTKINRWLTDDSVIDDLPEINPED
jgi:hypothetical protein